MRALIAVLPGDGVGPEVTKEAQRVLQAVAERGDHDFTFREALIGGIAIDETGEPLPVATREAVTHADAVLLGAVGGPKWSDPSASVRPEQGLLGLRALLGVYANIRPVAVHPALAAAAPLKPELLENVDIVFVRELTGGLYFGQKTHDRDASGASTRASDLCVYTTEEVERVVRMAADIARARRRKLLSVDKANVLATSRLWREVTTRVMRDEFPDVALEHALVDSFAMHLITTPSRFDVVVTENLFGDILTDEAAVLAGSIGVLPSASLGDASTDGLRRGLYEPIHGSAPDIAGKGIANPAGAILSAALLLRHSLGLTDDAALIEAAVSETITAGIRTADCVGPGQRACSTADFGDAVLERLFARSASMH
ncbi:MAG: 3-isopropylmalate dehydrogenase [Gemmatimonadaceae bacterium]|nr:3-isopropylmalate dehydrogenase [Gemmatimonadaceae bacterium]